MARQAAYTREDRSEAEGLYTTEHSLAWLMAIIAVAMGILGLLVGFGVLDGDEEGVTGGANAIGAELANWQEGLLWIVPAITAGILAYTLHINDHHRSTRRREDQAEAGLFNAEHWLAYLMALVAIVTGALGLLVGFDVFGNDNTFADGMVWAVYSLVPATLAMALHNVRAHQMVSEEDVIVRLIEERTGTRAAGPAMRPERASERGESQT